MAINAYTGLMGSGKTFEVVQSVILPALLSGRRVVTNVTGLQVLDINAYLVEKFNADPAKLGSIVQVLNDQVGSSQFFPAEAKEGLAPLDSIVKGGDLVVIDECWRWWAQGMKVSIEHMTFFRMHRHFVEPTTLGTCDIVLVVQDIGDLDRKMRVVVENTYRMTKLKALGTSKRYRVDVYSGYKITTKTPKIREIQRAYDPEIFKLYSSYSQGATGGKEGVIDKRGTIWGGAMFKLVLPIFFIIGCVAFWSLSGFFHPKPKNLPATATPNAPGAVVVANQVASAQQQPAQPSESDWRVKGHFSSNRRHIVVFARGDSTRVLIDPEGFSYDGMRVTGYLDGKIVSNNTGADTSGPSKPWSAIGQK